MAWSVRYVYVADLGKPDAVHDLGIFPTLNQAISAAVNDTEDGLNIARIEGDLPRISHSDFWSQCSRIENTIWHNDPPTGQLTVIQEVQDPA